MTYPEPIPGIVENLRDYGLCLNPNVVICDRRVVDEAAAHIERLERAVWDSRALPLRTDIRDILDSHAVLLEALEGLLAHPGTHHDACIHWEQGGCDCEFSEVANAARAAIAKARGEQP